MEKEPLRKPSFEKPSFELHQPKIKNDKISTLLLNADLLIKYGEKKLARYLIQQALNLNSKNPEALRRLIPCMSPFSEYEQIVKIYKTLLKIKYDFRTLADLGNCYYQKGDDVKALNAYRDALLTLTYEEEGLFEVYKNMGNILVKERDYEAAEEFYNKAFTLRSNSDVLQINLGTLDLQKENHERALERFRKALEINPRNDKAWVGLALVHNLMGDHVLAQANLDNAIDINPFNKTAIQLASSWAVRDKKFDSAILHLETYLTQSEFDEEISLILIHLFCLSNRFDLAKIELNRLLLWNPKHQQALMLEKEICEQITN